MKPTIRESETQRFDQDVQVLYRVVFQVEEIDPMSLFDGFDDAQRDQSRQSLTIRWTLR